MIKCAMKWKKVPIALMLLVGNGYASENVFYSQCGQDAFVYNRFFKNKTDGIFVDIGAHDGITYSNTYFFEKHCGWKGICVEPIPEIFEQLRCNRNCICIAGCIYHKASTVQFLRVVSTVGEHTEMLSGIIEHYDPRHRHRIAYETSNGAGICQEIIVQCYALNDLLALYGLYHIDYLSLDTEGGELEILKSIDFARFAIDVIDVENNYHDPEFELFLSVQGYTKIATMPYCGDEVYVHRSFFVT